MNLRRAWKEREVGSCAKLARASIMMDIFTKIVDTNRKPNTRPIMPLVVI